MILCECVFQTQIRISKIDNDNGKLVKLQKISCCGKSTFTEIFVDCQLRTNLNTCIVILLTKLN
jgi:hypothetical protein